MAPRSAKRMRTNDGGGKQTFANPSYVRSVNRKYAAKRASTRVVPGYTRRVGYYGRYAGAIAEKKFFDTDIGFTFDKVLEVPTGGQLTLIPQGDTQSTRDGRKATIESIQIRGNLQYAPATAATAATLVHLYVVLDTQCNGSAAANIDVFDSSAANDATSFAMLNLNNSGRFRILKHMRWEFNPPAGATGAYNNVIQQCEFFKKCSIPVDWSSTTGALTEIRSNNIFLMAGSAGTANDLVTFTGRARLRFRG